MPRNSYVLINQRSFDVSRIMAAFNSDSSLMNASTSLLIDPLRLQVLLGDMCGRFDVDSLAECASTNTLLLERAEHGAAAGSVIVTDRQTAGRGSRGRSWLAAPESSLTFSVLWRFDGGVERLAGLSLAVGVAVVQALEICGAAGITLKWPNDILYNNSKLGGILVELQSSPGCASVVVGIGLNLSLPEGGYAGESFALPVTALDCLIQPLPERHALLAQLLIKLADVFDQFASGGFAVLREQWQMRHAWQDKYVHMLRDGKLEKEGVCCGADVDGALLLRTAAGVERCLSGDLSLRCA
jgi:BirA family transcriptional regulator, biotin operon repressor / biotin---[acetyl-CoA-carboxylase] ligase